MLLTITTTHQPATDLGYLLFKHPARVQTFPLTFGEAHVFYPEATPERCTAALLLDINPIGLIRGKNNFALEQYVNDRPYVASSFLSVALAEVFGSAMTGRSRERPELAQSSLPFVAKVMALPARGGEELLHRLFEPLGYTVNTAAYELDPHFPEWGASGYYTLELEHVCRISDLLSHLYVLIPVLDNDKHYYVSEDEIAKLLRHGEGWLAAHPERQLIAARYLKYQSRLTRTALAQLADETRVSDIPDEDEALPEEKISLHTQRMGAVMAALKQSGAKRVLDLGCGEGQLLRRLLEDKQFESILGMDVSYRALEMAAERLKLDRLPTHQRQRIHLMQGSLMYSDERLNGYDAAALVEVIEHLDTPRLAALERIVFEFAHPGTVVVTTPNAEYNPQWETLPAGTFRHRDHRFEWTRAEFQTWATQVAARFGYRVRFLPIGLEDHAVGAPTQMAIFEVQA